MCKNSERLTGLFIGFLIGVLAVTVLYEVLS